MRADARRREVHGQRRAQAAGADTQDFGGFEPLLAFHRHFGHDQMPRVAQHFVIGQLFQIRVLGQVKRRRAARADGIQAAGDARHDGQRVAVLDGRLRRPASSGCLRR